MLVATINSQASDLVASREMVVVEEEHTEEQIQIRMVELEDDMIEIVAMPHAETWVEGSMLPYPRVQACHWLKTRTRYISRNSVGCFRC